MTQRINQSSVAACAARSKPTLAYLSDMSLLQAELLQPARPSKQLFKPYWVNYSHGCFMLGSGPPGEGLIMTWQDAEPLADIQYIGLSAWDKHVSYRHIQLHPTLSSSILADYQQQQQQQQGRIPSYNGKPWQADSDSESSRVPKLALLCCEHLKAIARPSNVCQGLALAEVLSPVADLIRPALMTVLITSLAQVVQDQAVAFCHLGEETIQDLLSSNLQV